MTAHRLAVALLAAAACLFSAAPALAQTRGATLEAIQKRGAVACGVTPGAMGVAFSDDKGGWRGFDVDFCRALAAAIFDDPKKIRITSLAPKERVAALQAGGVDVLVSGAPWTEARDAGQRLLYAAITFYDGQSFLTHRKLGLASAKDFGETTICVPQGTSLELDLAEYIRQRKASLKPRALPSLEEAIKAYETGVCDAVSAEASVLYAERARLAQPEEHDVLPDLISKAPHGPILRQGDDQWFNIVRWTHFAMLDAEELGVASSNVDEALKSETPEIRRLLGVDGDHGEGMGLDSDWAYRIVKHVGNYAEVFERNLGAPLAMERRLNALWTKGGLFYAPPVR